MELQTIQNKIYAIREQKVMLDFDLAMLYEIETKYLKRAVKRNINRFPEDFMFELTSEEWESLRCQIGALNNGRGQFPKYLPFAFTEQGVAMLASVLNSPKAIEVNIQIVRAFVFLRHYALTNKELTEKLHELERKYDKQFDDVFDVLNYLVKQNKQQITQKERKKIGFTTED